MRYISETNQVPVAGEYDVVVAGGGVAGVSAALSAARAGKRTLLIEKSTILGGLATLGLINFFVPMCNGRGKKIISGMCEELLRLSIRYGYDTLPEEWKRGAPEAPTNVRYVTRYSANIFALTLTELMRDEGIDLLYDSVVSAPVMKDGVCEGVIVENKSGREFYAAGFVVDATGDADVLARAGVPTAEGLNFFTYSAYAIDLAHCRKAAESGRIEDAMFGVCGGGASLYGDNHPAGRRRYRGTSGREVSEYLIDNQIELLQKLKGQERFSRDVAQLPGMAQLRTTRHIVGDYTLTLGDVYRHFDDSLGAICDFDNRDALYEVPLRALTRADAPNLIAAGRCASGEGYAWDVLRVIPPAIQTGQAAGLVAAEALSTGKRASDIDVGKVQRALEKTGVSIHFDDADLPENPQAQPERCVLLGHL